VAAHLAPYLPGHPMVKTGGTRAIHALSAAPWGSASILLISYAYMKMLGRDGMTDATRYAILNANYIKSRLESHYPVLYTRANGRVAHEMIFDLRPLKQASGVDETDVAKRLMDFGFRSARRFRRSSTASSIGKTTRSRTRRIPPPPSHPTIGLTATRASRPPFPRHSSARTSTGRASDASTIRTAIGISCAPARRSRSTCPATATRCLFSYQLSAISCQVSALLPFGLPAQLIPRRRKRIKG
ncbi:MAG: hypothetical protein DMF99_26245, partial [Acidobacteria bacterium]